jgi:hypothetical protein
MATTTPTQPTARQQQRRAMVIAHGRLLDESDDGGVGRDDALTQSAMQSTSRNVTSTVPRQQQQHDYSSCVVSNGFCFFLQNCGLSRALFAVE